MEKRNENTISASKNAREQGADTQKTLGNGGTGSAPAGLGKGGKARPFLQRRFPSLPQYLLILGGELDDVAVAEVVGGLGAEPGRALHHRIARVHELLGGDEARAVVAADLLEVPLLEPDDEVVVLRVPVVEGRDMQPAVQAVELILLVGKLLVGRVREEDDPLMAAAGDAHQAHVLDVAVQRHLAEHLEDDRAVD